MGAADVVVDGGGNAGHLETVPRLRRPAGEGQRAAEGAVAADGHNGVQPQQLAGGQGPVLARHSAEFIAAGSIQEGAALVDDMADAGGVHADKITADEPVPPAANADAVDAAGQSGAHYGPNGGIHAGGVAAAGQNADTLYLMIHMLPPMCM